MEEICMSQNKYMAQSVFEPQKKSPSRKSSGKKRSGERNSELEAMRREFVRYKKDMEIEMEDLRKRTKNQ